MIDINCLGDNEFLKRLYPKGLDPIVMIKEITISINGVSEFSFFIKQKPNLNIKKWGSWNHDFNCLWIKTANYCNFKKLIVYNLNEMGFNEIIMRKMESGNIEISSSKLESKCEIILDINDRFIIQEIVPINI